MIQHGVEGWNFSNSLVEILLRALKIHYFAREPEKEWQKNILRRCGQKIHNQFWKVLFCSWHGHWILHFIFIFWLFDGYRNLLGDLRDFWCLKVQFLTVLFPSITNGTKYVYSFVNTVGIVVIIVVFLPHFLLLSSDVKQSEFEQVAI